MDSEDLAKIGVEEFRRHLIFDILAGLGRGDLGVEFAGIEGRGVVGYSSRGAEGAGAGLLFGGIIFHIRGPVPHVPDFTLVYPGPVW